MSYCSGEVENVEFEISEEVAYEALIDSLMFENMKSGWAVECPEENAKEARWVLLTMLKFEVEVASF